MELVILLVRTLFFYFLVMLVMYSFWKKKKPTLADLLIAFIVAQFSVLAIDEPGKPLSVILLPISILLILHYVFGPVFRKKKTDQPASWGEQKPLQERKPIRVQTADVEMGALEPMVIQQPIGILPLPLILDGKVLDMNLGKIGKTRFWLKNEVQKFGARRFKEVAYCSIDRQGTMFLDKKKA